MDTNTTYIVTSLANLTLFGQGEGIDTAEIAVPRERLGDLENCMEIHGRERSRGGGCRPSRTNVKEPMPDSHKKPAKTFEDRRGFFYEVEIVSSTSMRGEPIAPPTTSLSLITLYAVSISSNLASSTAISTVVSTPCRTGMT